MYINYKRFCLWVKQVIVAYNKDQSPNKYQSPNKLNLGVGANRTEEEKPLILNVVKCLSRIKEYLPIVGLVDFNKLSAKLIFGADNGLLSLRTEDCLLYAFSVAGIVLSVVAYDYQEIGVLVTLFCLFHACVGLILPSLARLRTLYVPNELRGGMMSLSLVPVSAAILFFLVQGGYYRNIENSTIIAFAALGLFSAAGSMYLLKQWGKQLHNDWHKI
ncbi:hypothetical protein POM88_023689 [Heracleum sosnowskyi]|uniref:Uncharacterized protein n=1 Tax=Heracleum sosnowskyi TaxID=360622 RepID=A0AAD8MUV4_9APIA|nr:hypothetical protein POM88_023689 [Heracleum sosnowskyi]